MGLDPAAMAAAGAPAGAPAGAFPALPPGIPPEMMANAMQPGVPGGPMPATGMGGPGFSGLIPRSSLRNVVSHLRRTGESYGSNASGFSQFSNPLNLLQNKSMPPTPKGVPMQDKSRPSLIPNIAGHNRKVGGSVDTNIPSRKTTSTQSNILNRTFSIQPKK